MQYSEKFELDGLDRIWRCDVHCPLEHKVDDRRKVRRVTLLVRTVHVQVKRIAKNVLKRSPLVNTPLKLKPKV